MNLGKRIDWTSNALDLVLGNESPAEDNPPCLGELQSFAPAIEERREMLGIVITTEQNVRKQTLTREAKAQLAACLQEAHPEIKNPENQVLAQDLLRFVDEQAAP